MEKPLDDSVYRVARVCGGELLFFGGFTEMGFPQWVAEGSANAFYPMAREIVMRIRRRMTKGERKGSFLLRTQK